MVGGVENGDNPISQWGKFDQLLGLLRIGAYTEYEIFINHLASKDKDINHAIAFLAAIEMLFGTDVEITSIPSSDLWGKSVEIENLYRTELAKL